MRNEYVRNAGIHSALLAVVILLLSPFQLGAQPSEKKIDLGKDPAPVCGIADTVDPAIYNSLKRFWLEAWGTDLVVGEYGMTLREAGAPDHWDVLVVSRSAERAIDRGSFIEEVRHPVNLGAAAVDRSYVQVARATHLQRYIAAGTVVGSTGNSIAVSALVTELGIEGGPPIRLFSVFRFGTDTADSVDHAESIAHQLNGEPVFKGDAVEVITSAEKSGSQHCVNSCTTQKNLNIAACFLAQTTCNSIAYAAAAECNEECEGSSNQSACESVCDAALAAALALCEDFFWDCYAAASLQWLLCIEGCDCNPVLSSDGSSTKIIC